jgi:hypothetical protein
MPGVSAPAVQAWLTRARRYDDTRKALDILERSALAAPPVLVAPVTPEPAPELPGTIIPE